MMINAQLFKGIRSWLHARVIRNSSSYDYCRLLPDLAARFATCTSRSDLESVLVGYFRSLFGIGTAALYVPNQTSGMFIPGEWSRQLPDFPASPSLLIYLLNSKGVWNSADNEYELAEAEHDFVNACGVRTIVPVICRQQVTGLVMLGPAVTGRALTDENAAHMRFIAAYAGLALANMILLDELDTTRELAGRARMSSFIVHDLKNLTHSLSLMVDNAEEHISNFAFQRDLIESIRHTVENMKLLSQQLKGVSGTLPFRRQLMDIRFLCDTVIQEFRKTRPQAAIVLKGDSVSCQVDGEEFRKVVVNLLENALDAIGGYGLIVVETGVRGGMASLSIADTGCGMTPEFISDQLFRPFRSTKTTGMGIGLYQCRQIVESLGGNITAASERGKGSTFSIYLPAADRNPIAGVSAVA